MVSVRAVNSRIVLEQRATEAKSSEITAIPELLETLLLHGRIVTIEAMGCQTAVAAKIACAMRRRRRRSPQQPSSPSPQTRT